MDDDRPARPARPAILRVSAAIAAALTCALGAYLLIEATRPESGLISFTFLLILPAAICAFAAYVADPWKDRPHHFYTMIPVWMLAAITVASLVFLHEGVICIILLAPFWLALGLVGTEITYRLRRRSGDDGSYCIAVLALPLIAMQIEPLIALPIADAAVTRTVTIDASPAQIWPLLRGVPDVRPDEGQWNITQSLIGVPRPVGAHLARDGLGADRYARWQHNIRFRERIVDWQQGERIGWRFIFDDVAAWGYTDRHLLPNSRYFQITTGGYRLRSLPDGRTEVSLHTEYRIQTPVNAYSELWGELFLGDVQNNILAVIKQRAEVRAPTADIGAR